VGKAVEKCSNIGGRKTTNERRTTNDERTNDWSDGSMVRWFDGSMDRWIDGPNSRNFDAVYDAAFNAVYDAAFDATIDGVNTNETKTSKCQTQKKLAWTDLDRVSFKKNFQRVKRRI
jgi:hypothetical protein